MIVSFRCKETEKLFRRKMTRLMDVRLQKHAYRKLVMLNAASVLDDLRVPPGNRLEALSGDRNGQYSIRINQQYRICFCWDSGRVTDVQIIDYH
ncbi:type II toxin-antitoxin system RelE/ParE family toxin [Thalassospira sp.]|uniref:type II toxin-antitoxin system RelE/ParE family toxin n=1 Tax=Thalassospira sp. TaxID=1912094 RepID=UPI002733B897|nr:type II toxin-antitoxin system RelE/ParE family toxin [Thalassospira sp.]MDP2697477.1 type II toxin-antitoxin system RelE/ParE family toxin [Thalassospira sp.]